MLRYLRDKTCQNQEFDFLFNNKKLRRTASYKVLIECYSPNPGLLVIPKVYSEPTSQITEGWWMSFVPAKFFHFVGT